MMEQAFESLWMEAIRIAKDSSDYQAAFDNEYNVSLIDGPSGTELFSELLRGNFSIFKFVELSRDWRPKHGFLQTLQDIAFRVKGLAERQPLIATLSFRICSILIQVAITFPDFERRLLDHISLVKDLFQTRDWSFLARDKTSYQFKAAANCLSQLLILHSLAEVRSRSSRFVRVVKSFIGLSSPQRNIASLDKAVACLEEALQAVTPAAPGRVYDNTTLNHQSSAILGNVDLKVFHNAVIIGGYDQQQPQLDGASDTISQVLRSYARHNLEGLIHNNMTQKSYTSGAAKSQGGEENHDIANFVRSHTLLNFPQLEIVSKTCRWILKSRVWLDWREDRQRKILLVTGNLGCGKTAVAKILLDDVAQDAHKPVLAVHFSSTHNYQQPVARTFCVSLVAQLLRICDPAHCTDVQSVIRDFGLFKDDIWRCSQQNLLTVIVRLVALCQPYFLVVDGLDECGTTAEQEKIARILTSLARKRSLSIIVTARHTNLFPEKCSTKIVLTKDSNDREIAKGLNRDLQLFIDHRFDQVQFWRHDGKRTRHKKIRNFIINQSQGNFLHARILIDTMSHCQTLGELDTAMKSSSLNAELRHRYDHLSNIIESSLNPNHIIRRKQILQILMVAQAPLHVEHMEELLCLDLTTGDRDWQAESRNIRTELQMLGQDFLEILESGEVRFYHSAAKEYFMNRIASDDANLYLAQKCLAILSRSFYRQAGTASGMLERHILKGINSAPSGNRLPSEESPIYEYAALHFHEHLLLISAPPRDLLLKLSRFLHGTEFVTWSESLIDFASNAASNKKISVYRSLLAWSERLPAGEQDELGIRDFFKFPHTLLANILREHEDKILQYLPRIRIAEYFNAGPQSLRDLETSHEEKKIVVAGLSELRGVDDRFVMTNRAYLYLDYLWKKQFIKARAELEQLYDAQKRLLKPDDSEIYLTAHILAGAYIALGENSYAQQILADAIESVGQKFGQTYRLFLLLFLLEGQRLEVVRDLKKATKCYKLVLEVNEKLAGSGDGMTIMAKVALGAILRKQEGFKSSHRLLFAGFGARVNTVSVNLNVTVDAALQLALLHRDMGNHQQCLEVLESVRGSVVFEEDFERKCQLMHLEALVAFDRGQYTAPKKEILKLIDYVSGENRSLNNRELLWIRLDLSEVMEQHKEAGEALMLFMDLVRAKTEDQAELQDYYQPESAEQLRAAKTALGYVREAKTKEAQFELDRLNLEWVRQDDFYILIQGGPTLDTSLIRPVSSISIASEESSGADFKK